MPDWNLCCLNPYYTGIHLHNINAQENTRAGSLNPYYTGIHLHYNLRRYNQKMHKS